MHPLRQPPFHHTDKHKDKHNDPQTHPTQAEGWDSRLVIMREGARRGMLSPGRIWNPSPRTCS